jgi:hypothetical protein
MTNREYLESENWRVRLAMTIGRYACAAARRRAMMGEFAAEYGDPDSGEYAARDAEETMRAYVISYQHNEKVLERHRAQKKARPLAEQPAGEHRPDEMLRRY